MNYEAIEEDDIPTSSSVIPIVLAMLAFLLGAAGLYFGFRANQRLNSTDILMQERSSNVEEMEKVIAFFDARFSELETKISDQERILNRLKAYSSQSDQAIKKLAGELNTNREQIVKTAKQLNAMRAGGLIGSSVSSSVVQPIVGGEDAVSGFSTTEEKKTYTIVSGDNFSKIASKFRVSVQAIEDANPGADSRRLRIGQTIIIPSN